MARINKTVGNALRKNRKVKIYFFFLFLSTLIWLLIELSKFNVDTIKTKVSFYNLPSSKTLLSSPIIEINALIKTSGFNLIKYKINPPKIAFNLSNSGHIGLSYFVLPNAELIDLKTNLSKESTVLKFLKDTIFVEFGNNISKKVPVIPNLKVNFKLGYNYIEDLKIVPDSIVIIGPKKMVDSVIEISTEKMELNDIYEDVEVEMKLKLPSKNKNVLISASSVNISGKVDKFTEGKFLIPVSIINKPVGIKIVPFPKEIEVIYQSGLSHFNKITKNDIQIVFDYLQYKNDTLVRYLTPKIEEKSGLISTLKINPAQIEFLIQK